MPHIGIGLATLLASGIGGGTALAAAKMGSNASKNASGSAVDLQRQLAEQELARSKPAYDAAYNYYSKLLGGSPDEIQRLLAPEINMINQQFSAVGQNLLSSQYTRGGALDKAMRNLGAGQAMTLANLYGGVRPKAADALAALAGRSTANAASTLASANEANYRNQMLRQSALEGVGGLITRVLLTPGLFTRGNSGGGGAFPSNQSNMALPFTSFIPPAVNPSSGNPYSLGNPILSDTPNINPFDLRQYGKG